MKNLKFYLQLKRAIGFYNLETNKLYRITSRGFIDPDWSQYYLWINAQTDDFNKHDYRAAWFCEHKEAIFCGSGYLLGRVFLIDSEEEYQLTKRLLVD